LKTFLKSLVAVSALCLIASACSTKPAEAPAAPSATRPLPATIQEAVSNSYRTPANKERDQYRHPVQTLEFFGLQPEMTVIEISPASGWYTEILAPYLASKGQYIAADRAESVPSVEAWSKQNPEVSSKIKKTVFQAPKELDIAPEGSADMVLTFRNVHNWMAKGNEAVSFKAFFKALKPGGTLGVVEHRANPKSKHDSKAKSGYVVEKDVIKFAKAAGFKLVGKSEINANPKDLKNYKAGVWTLPPVLTLKDKDREKYMAIGESDRMTLRFVKPVK
jgi:predicted methyltransferase